MAIRRRRPFGRLSEERLSQFERRLPDPLPDDYRRFLVQSNGAEFIDCPEFEDVQGGTCLETLFGLHAGPPHFQLDAIRAAFNDSLPDSLLVIGADPYGNYFVIGLSEPQRGRVYFADHEQLRSSLIEVARSFSALLQRAGTDEVARRAPATPADAVAERDADALQRLVDDGESAGGLVHRSVRSQHSGLLQIVLAHGGDANELGGIGGEETPLFVAARNGRRDMVELLLEHGADPNARCGDGITVLHTAEPWPDVLRVLANAGAEPTTPRLETAVLRALERD